jgi:CubicO group peptidase (beta-lactamase class C family)
MDQYLQTLLAKYSLPALGAAIAGEEQVIEQAVVGVRKLGGETPAAIDDRFHLGSVAKPMTATLIARLVETGRAAWDIPLAAVFPDRKGLIHPLLEQITFEDLLSHRAGLQPFEDDEEFDVLPNWEGEAAGRRAAFSMWLVEQPPFAPPRTEHIYSNAGYSLAATMAERLTGQTWENLMRQEIFRPLKMEKTGFGWPARAGAAEPWGHQDQEGIITPHDPDDAYPVDLIEPAGDVHASIGDLVRFGQLHLNGLLGKDGWLRAETIQKLHLASEGEYALGWNIRSFGNHHVGGAGTFFAALLVSAADRRIYVLVTNCGAQRSAELSSELFSHMKRR